MSFLGSLVSGVFGLFGSKKRKQPQTQVVENRVDYGRMVADAEAAGFNPLTALRNGGSAGFSSSTTTHPGLSSNVDALSQIGGALGDALSQRIDPNARRQAALESALMDYQLSTIQNRAKAPMMFGDVPTKTASGVRVQTTPALSSSKRSPPAAAAAATPVSDRWLAAPKPSKDALPIWVRGVDRDGKPMWIPNPDGPDAEQLAFSALTRAQSGIESAADSLWNWREHVKMRKLTPAEKKKQDESWLPGWVPRFSLSW